MEIGFVLGPNYESDLIQLKLEVVHGGLTDTSLGNKESDYSGMRKAAMGTEDDEAEPRKDGA
ncbi:hypothetical protein Ancab_023300 [Ancistrocladus abbreviatus]